jgi:pyruvate dehydrogenase E1 component alpha subunit
MKKLDAYFESLRIRKIEEMIALRYPEQEMRCPTHLSIGQELVPVVVSNFLSKDDKAFSSHRAHAHYLAKGGSLKKMIAELYGKATGCTGGRGGSMHLTDLDCGFIASTAIVGNSIPLAVGSALSQKLQNSNFLTVSYFGDGATEEGAFYESLNFAAVKSLPILFICENNRYSVYSPLEVRQPVNRSITDLSQSIGVESFHADGSLLIPLTYAVESAIEYIRKNNAPALLELDTYRHREHCGPNFDDDLNYRAAGEVKTWLEKDPLKLLFAELSSDQHFEKTHNEMIIKIKNEIEDAFLFAENSPFPNPQLNEEFLYAK